MNDIAKSIAENMLQCAYDNGFMESNELTLIPELANVEKELFINLFKELHKYLERKKSSSLEVDEISSLFTFVFAKAAEAVTVYKQNGEFKLEYLGMFDGKIPIYADESLIGYIKKINFSGLMAQSFLDWSEKNPDLEQPELVLFEALKWHWRCSQSLSACFLQLPL